MHLSMIYIYLYINHSNNVSAITNLFLPQFILLPCVKEMRHWLAFIWLAMFFIRPLIWNTSTGVRKTLPLLTASKKLGGNQGKLQELEKGPSIKYLSTFFVIFEFWQISTTCQHFFTPIRHHIFSIFDVLYGWPKRLPP